MPCRKDCYADIEKYRQTVRNQRKRYYARSANKYPRRRWTEDEISQVMERSMPDSKLSKQIRRSVGAIQTLRSKYKDI